MMNIMNRKITFFGLLPTQAVLTAGMEAYLTKLKLEN